MVSKRAASQEQYKVAERPAVPAVSLHAADRVLIVDDSQRVLNFLQIKFKASGYETDTACNGKDALAKVRSFRPTGIVMDFEMPGGDGVRTLQEARAYTSAPAILISGHDLSLISLQKLANVYFVAKPFNPDHLVLKMRSMIEQAG
ncbi:MAG: response regulator [Chloroflexi bacterium]|nr:response regulator [Chloroflexota bacterium]